MTPIEWFILAGSAALGVGTIKACKRLIASYKHRQNEREVNAFLQGQKSESQVQATREALFAGYSLGQIEKWAIGQMYGDLQWNRWSTSTQIEMVSLTHDVLWGRSSHPAIEGRDIRSELQAAGVRPILMKGES